MLDFYQQLVQRLGQESVVLATVIQVKGSVPREVGAKMLIGSDGSTYGTIGGGAGEGKVLQQALEVLETGEKRRVEIDLSGARDRKTQGVCGGIMQVWLERWVGADAIALTRQILDILTSGQAGALVTPLDGMGKPFVQVQCRQSIPLLTPTHFIEPLLPLPTLLIIGAGHVALPLAQIADRIGFEVIVQDDRPEFAARERFPDASAILIQPIAAALETLSPRQNLYVALVTRGIEQDLAALRVLLKRPVEYLGAIGSEKRVRLVHQQLQREGYAPHLLQQIYAPIGLDIGALTPEEIAVSICAELIQVRRGGSGKSLSRGRHFTARSHFRSLNPY